MKVKIISVIIFSLLLESASLSHKEISKMVAKIKHERGGIGLSTLDGTPNPFDVIEPKEEVKEVEVEKPKETKKSIKYNISAILNHSAFINKKWYKVGDRVGDYKVIYIGKNYASLKNREGEIKKITIPQKKKIKLFKGN